MVAVRPIHVKFYKYICVHLGVERMDGPLATFSFSFLFGDTESKLGQFRSLKMSELAGGNLRIHIIISSWFKQTTFRFFFPSILQGSLDFRSKKNTKKPQHPSLHSSKQRSSVVYLGSRHHLLHLLKIWHLPRQVPLVWRVATGIYNDLFPKKNMQPSKLDDHLASA